MKNLIIMALLAVFIISAAVYNFVSINSSVKMRNYLKNPAVPEKECFADSLSLASGAIFSNRFRPLKSAGVEHAEPSGDISPAHFRLQRCYPDPDPSKIFIRFEVSDLAGGQFPLEIEICNPRGEIIRNLYSGILKPGQYEICWNGQNDSGFLQNPGIYFLKIESRPQTTLQKLLVMR